MQFKCSGVEWTRVESSEEREQERGAGKRESEKSEKATRRERERVQHNTVEWINGGKTSERGEKRGKIEAMEAKRGKVWMRRKTKTKECHDSPRAMCERECERAREKEG